MTANHLNSASEVAAALTRCKVMVDMSQFGLGAEEDEDDAAELPIAHTTVQAATDAA